MCDSICIWVVEAGPGDKASLGYKRLMSQANKQAKPYNIYKCKLLKLYLNIV